MINQQVFSIKKDNEVTQNLIPPLYSKLVQKEHFFSEKNVLEYNYLTILQQIGLASVLPIILNKSNYVLI